MEEIFYKHTSIVIRLIEKEVQKSAEAAKWHKMIWCQMIWSHSPIFHGSVQVIGWILFFTLTFVCICKMSIHDFILKRGLSPYILWI